MESVDEIEKLSEKVNDLRVKVRRNVENARRLRRAAAFDSNRFLESEIITEEDIRGLCNRIKRRKHATEEDLIKLSNAFFQSEANISAFTNTTGAIKVVVKEFIGRERKLLAAQCLCNLSLGNDVACSKIASFAGCYLNIYLRNLKDFTLIKVCLWMAQNLATCPKALDILMCQELLANCLFILNDSGDTDIRHEAMQLLDIIVEKRWSKLGIDEKDTVCKSALTYAMKFNSDYLSLQCLHRIADTQFPALSTEESQKLTDLLTSNLLKFNADATDDCLVYFSIKILLKLFKIDLRHLAQFLESFIRNEKKLSSAINESFKHPKFYGCGKELFKFAAAIYQTDHQAVVDYLHYDSMEENLKIPTIFE